MYIENKEYDKGYEAASKYYEQRLKEQSEQREKWMKERLLGLLVAMENIDKIYPCEDKYEGCIHFLRALNEKDKGWI